MSNDIDAQALAALTADLNGAPAEQVAQQPDAGVQEPAPTEGVTYSEDSFTNVDPASLPPEMQAIYKSLQADYTRKQQEAAPYRKLGMPADQLEQLVTWYSTLSSDTSAQLELYNNLASYLAQNGLLDQEQPTANEGIDSWLPEADTGNDTEQSSLEAEVRRLTERLNSMDEDARLNQEAIELWEIEQGIREANPHYTDKDVEYIYKLGLAYGGNIIEGEREYRQLRESALSAYLENKGSVPAGHVQPSGSGFAQAPVRVETLEDAERIAMERIRRGEYNLYND